MTLRRRVGCSIGRPCTSWTLVCSVSLLLDQTLFVNRESVVVAFLTSVSRERLLDITESRYTNSWTASTSYCATVMDAPRPDPSPASFLRLMVSPKSLTASAKRFMSWCRSSSGWVVTARRLQTRTPCVGGDGHVVCRQELPGWVVTATSSADRNSLGG